MATISNDDSVETVAFTLRDTKRLAILSLVALAHFEVPLAAQILQEHFIGPSDSVELDRMDHHD